MNKKVFRLIHLWLSVPFGLIAVLMCLSGAILIFERDFGHIGQAEVTPLGRSELPLDSILTLAQKQVPKGKQIIGITTYSNPNHAYKIMLNKPAMAAVWVDQYTGKVIGEYKRAEIFKLASAAHRRLFGKAKADSTFGATTGKMIIGITTIAMLAIIISGLIVWWPAEGMWKRKLSISTQHGAYRFWHDFHCVGGAITSLILAICILTGLNWSFGWYRKAFYAIFSTQPAKSALHKTPAENFTAWEIAYRKIKAKNPDKEIRIYQGEADVVIGGSGNQQAYDTYKFNVSSGQVSSLTSYSEKAKATQIKGWIYTLHVGSWFGWISKIIYLLTVLIGASLPITGYYLWIKRLIRKKQK
ncbi:MAG: PepSY domain-containing protein [Muribaculaceae bacterium]|nr:PepSY domain-containing protein [Muribaculaceae bacterium]